MSTCKEDKRPSLLCFYPKHSTDTGQFSCNQTHPKFAPPLPPIWNQIWIVAGNTVKTFLWKRWSKLSLSDPVLVKLFWRWKESLESNKGRNSISRCCDKLVNLFGNKISQLTDISVYKKNVQRKRSRYLWIFSSHYLRLLVETIRLLFLSGTSWKEEQRSKSGGMYVEAVSWLVVRVSSS